MPFDLSPFPGSTFDPEPTAARRLRAVHENLPQVAIQRPRTLQPRRDNRNREEDRERQPGPGPYVYLPRRTRQPVDPHGPPQIHPLNEWLLRKWENHEAFLGLYFAHWNWVQYHGTLKTTPAVAAGVANHQWNVRELIERTSSYAEAA